MWTGRYSIIFWVKHHKHYISLRKTVHSILQDSETKFQLSCSYCWQILPLKKLQLLKIIYNWKCKQHKHVGFVILPHASFLADIGTSHLHPEDSIPPVILARWKGKPLTRMAALSPLTHGKHLPKFSPIWDQTLGLLTTQSGRIPD